MGSKLSQFPHLMTKYFLSHDQGDVWEEFSYKFEIGQGK